VDLLRLYATFPAIDKQMIKEIWTNSGKNEAAALRSLKLMAEPVLLNKDKSSSSSDAESGDELLGKQRRDVRKQLLRHRSTPGKFASGRTDWQHRVKGLLDNTSDDDETRPPPAADEMRGQLRIGINGLTAASPARYFSSISTRVVGDVSPKARLECPIIQETRERNSLRKVARGGSNAR